MQQQIWYLHWLTKVLSVTAMWHLSISTGDCCHYEFLQIIPPTPGFTLCAQLWSQGIKVNSIQTGCGVEQGLMGLYTLLYMQRAIWDQAEAEHGWRWGDDVAETERVRKRETNNRDYLADVHSRSNPWQRKCSVAMAICFSTNPRVMGQGSISSVSVVQEAVEIRALIIEHWYKGEELE